MPVKNIRVIVHVLQKDNGTENFQNTQQDRQYILDMVSTVNQMLRNNQGNYSDGCHASHITDTRIQFRIDRFLFHQDTDAWCSRHPSQGNSIGCNKYYTYVDNNPNLTTFEKDNYLHFFLAGPRSCNQQTLFTSGGYAAGIPTIDEKYIVMGGIYHQSVNPGNESWWFTNTGPEGWPRLFIHEIGHAYGLSHDQVIDGNCNPTETMTIMNEDSGPNMMGFSPCQIAEMHYYLESKDHCVGNTCPDVYKTVETNYCDIDQQAGDILISSGQSLIWDINKKLNRNIRILEGGELIVRCSLGMATNSTILVERGGRLIVDGGTITHNKEMWHTCDSESKWGGIRVEGYANQDLHTIQMRSPTYQMMVNDPGIVLVINQSTIAQAKNGIRTRPNTYDPNFFGGFIYAENSRFVNNKRAVEIMRYGFPSAIAFIDCDFVNDDGTGEHGVTNWGTRGIAFFDCDFLNLTRRGIYNYNAFATISKSRFTENLIGVDNVATFQLSNQITIGSPNPQLGNVFTGNEVGVQGMPVNQLNVQNNTFSKNQFGVAIEGPSQFLITDNLFEHEDNTKGVGVNLVQTDLTGFGRVTCNVFDDIFVGINNEGDNRVLSFNNNDFQTRYDVWVTNEGVFPGILSNQGADFNAQWNYFSTVFQNEQHINTTGSTVLFKYFYPTPDTGVDPRVDPKCALNDNPSTCVVGVPNNFDNHEAENGDPSCLEGESAPCNSIDCLDQVDLDISQLKNQIDNGVGTANDSITLSRLMTERVGIYSAVVNSLLMADDYSGLVNLLNSETSFIAHQDIVGFFTARKNYAEANNRINSYISSDTYVNDFHTTQQINLAILNPYSVVSAQQLGAAYLSDQQIADLEAVITNKTPAAAYAKALLTAMRGDVYIPDFPGERVEERSSLSKGDDVGIDKISVYPNPTTGQFTIDIPEHLSKAPLNLLISDVSGKIAFSANIAEHSQFTVPSSNWTAGLYIVQIMDNEGLRDYFKVIINP